MEASEARKIASDYNLHTDERQLKDVLEKISTAACAGKFEIYRSDLRDGVVGRLKVLGYNVTSNDDRDGFTNHLIRW